MPRKRALAVPALGSLFLATCLVSAPGGSAASAAAEAGASGQEIQSLRDRYSRTYQHENGTYRAEIAAGPIHYRVPDGRWRAIDNALVPSERPGYAYENAANSFKALFPEDLATDPIRIEAAGEAISFQLEGASGAPAEPGSAAADEVTAAYPNALPGVELSYRVGAEGVEELIELPTPEEAQEFSFATELSDGLEIEDEGTGASITDSEGAEVFELAPPLAYDAAGETDPLELEVDQTVSGTDAEVSVTPDPAWLADPEREYPVVVDPTVVSKIEYDASGDPINAAKDCWIGQDIDGPRCDTALRVGNDSNNKQRRSLLKFTPSIDERALIVSATLDLLAKGGSYSQGSTTIPVQVHQIDRTQGWSKQVTWVNRTATKAWDNNGGTVEGSVVDTVTPVIGSRAQWDVKTIVKSWINDAVKNRGFRLRPEGNDGTTEVTFGHSETTTSADQPYLTIVYEPAACDRYASTSGADTNAGTLSDPYATVGKLFDSLLAGQTGCFRAGTYTFDAESILTPNVTVRPYDNEEVTLQGSLRVRPDGFGTKIEGLTLNGNGPGPSKHGPNINADHVVLRDNEITNEHTGICIQVARYFDAPVPQDVVIEGNRVHNCGVLPATNHHHGIYISQGLRTVIRDNWFYDNADRGVQLYPNADETLVTGNVIDGNGQGLNFSCNDGTSCSDNNIAEGNIISNSTIRWNVAGHTQDQDADPITPNGSNILRNNCVWAPPSADPYDTNGGIDSNPDFFSEGTEPNDNLIEPPQYVNRAGENFRLEESSLCLGKYTGTMSLP